MLCRNFTNSRRFGRVPLRNRITRKRGGQRPMRANIKKTLHRPHRPHRPQLPGINVKFVMKRVQRLTEAERKKCNGIISEGFRDGATVDGLDVERDTCIIGMLGTRVVTFMGVRDPSTDVTRANNDKYLMHTVCTSEKYRGRGLVRQMFHYVAASPEYKTKSFWLKASNVDEPDKGLNQRSRFKIYSKTGFALQAGTEIRPGGETVASVDINPSRREILYHFAPGSNSAPVRADDMVVDACYMNSEHQSQGCVMTATAETMRGFNGRY